MAERTDCRFYRIKECSALKKLYCKEEETCAFYKAKKTGESPVRIPDVYLHRKERK